MSALPDIDAYGEVQARTLPRGRIWPEAGGQVWRQLTRALAIEPRRVSERALQLIDEADPRTCFETLDDWERVCGLPDPCAPSNATFEERRNAVVAVLTAQGGASRQYFIDLAIAYGHEIEIVEYRPFECGRSTCGHQIEVREIGSPVMRHVWRVRLTTSRLVYFRCGHQGAECGVDPHLTFERAEEVECLFERLKPAHTVLIFEYVEAT